MSLYTQRLGKVVAVARGARRPQSKMAGHLEPFGLVAVKLTSGRGGYHVANVESVRRFAPLWGDRDRLASAERCVELVDRLVKSASPDQALFDLLVAGLEALSLARTPARTTPLVEAAFRYHLVSQLGYTPELQRCAHCRRPLAAEENLFDFERGGVVCPRCPHTPTASPLPTDQLKLLRLLATTPVDFFATRTVPPTLGSAVSQILGQFADSIDQ